MQKSMHKLLCECNWNLKIKFGQDRLQWRSQKLFLGGFQGIEIARAKIFEATPPLIATTRAWRSISLAKTGLYRL